MNCCIQRKWAVRFIPNVESMQGLCHLGSALSGDPLCSINHLESYTLIKSISPFPPMQKQASFKFTTTHPAIGGFSDS
jgi:hypothetical protein